MFVSESSLDDEEGSGQRSQSVLSEPEIYSDDGLVESE